MANFTGTILTRAGRNLLAKAQTGATLTFTRVALGDGILPSNTNLEDLVSLVSEKVSLPITRIEVVGDGTVRLRFVLTNESIETGFFIRELGIFAQDPDNPNNEILYAVSYAGEEADFIPSPQVIRVEHVIDVYTVISNAQNVTAVISDTTALATQRDLTELANSFNNLINNISTDQIQDGAITTSKIADFAITTEKIADSAVTLSKLANVSYTPAPNVIVPLNAEGILDLSATYVKSNVYTFRRVNLTGATSDYELQVGEEAYIEFSNVTSVPLRIAVPLVTCFYQILVVITHISVGNLDYMLLPNNTTYSDQFSCWCMTISGNSDRLRSAFFHDLYSGSADVSPYILTQFVSIGTRSSFVMAGGGNTVSVSYSVWNNTATPWISLGSIASYSNQNLSGYILIRRLR